MKRCFTVWLLIAFINISMLVLFILVLILVPLICDQQITLSRRQDVRINFEREKNVPIVF